MDDEKRKISGTLGCFLILIALFFLSGCSLLPEAREMANLSLVRTIAIDKQGDNWQIALSTGEQPQGVAGEIVPPTVSLAEGNSLTASLKQAEKQSDEIVFYGYVDQVLVGEGVDSLPHILDYFTRASELSLGSQLWMVEGSARTALAVTAQTANKRLTTLVEESRLSQGCAIKTVGGLLTDLTETGGGYLPLLTENQSELCQIGYAVIKNDTVITTLKAGQAVGLELLESYAGGQLYHLRLDQGFAVVEVTQVNTLWCGHTTQNNLTSATVNLDLVVELVEFDTVLTQDRLTKIKTLLTQEVTHDVTQTLKTLQQYSVDPLRIGGEISLTTPIISKEIETDWEEIFQTLEVEIAVDCRVIATENNNG